MSVFFILIFSVCASPSRPSLVVVASSKATDPSTVSYLAPSVVTSFSPLPTIPEKRGGNEDTLQYTYAYACNTCCALHPHES
ncbi:hypothetical protein F5B21DRAFT_194956 [Xylaria acuta]|nr:hypothetical protein F5B21DRAFT_194956 [Xylaria acuta]